LPRPAALKQQAGRRRPPPLEGYATVKAAKSERN